MDKLDLIQYNLPEQTGAVEMVLKDDTMWCTQKAMAQLFGVKVPAISKHLKKIFEEGELDPATTISKMETVVHRTLSEVEIAFIESIDQLKELPKK